MRLIDADTLIDKLNTGCYTVSEIIEFILNAQTIDPIKRSKWIKTDYKPFIFTKCAYCGHRVEIQNKSRFCPGCGRRMDVE